MHLIITKLKKRNNTNVYTPLYTKGKLSCIMHYPQRKERNMDTLNKMKEKVTFLLETYPKLRDDDFLLIGAVYSQFYNVEHSDSFLDVMKHHDEKHLPSFESIRRTRQKVQEERLDLCSSKAKQREKQISFNNYYDFAKGN